jgi:hypothetical protein
LEIKEPLVLIFRKCFWNQRTSDFHFFWELKSLWFCLPFILKNQQFYGRLFFNSEIFWEPWLYLYHSWSKFFLRTVIIYLKRTSCRTAGC